MSSINNFSGRSDVINDNFSEKKVQMLRMVLFTGPEYIIGRYYALNLDDDKLKEELKKIQILIMNRTVNAKEVEKFCRDNYDQMKYFLRYF